MKILLIEDEPNLAHSIKEYLETQKFICECATTYIVAKDKISTYHYDCIILDLMLPDGDGMQLLEILKKQNNPEGVIILSAKEDLNTKIEGLHLGADDYLTKPFHLSELSARIHAIIRRKKSEGKNLMACNEITIDLLSRTVKVNAKHVTLTKKEFDLLFYFISNKNKVLSKSAIAEYLSGDMADMLDNFDFVYAHIKNLKNKLKIAGCKEYITTIYGIGYKWKND